MNNINEKIKVGMADFKVAAQEGILITLGLGSCIGIALYDRRNKVAGLAHIMLPKNTKEDKTKSVAKYADTAIDAMLEQMIELGAERKNITAKIAGGASMLGFKTSMDGTLSKGIGERNIEAVEEKLADLKITIKSKDVGANYGRTIELNIENGDLTVKAIGRDVIII